MPFARIAQAFCLITAILAPTGALADETITIDGIKAVLIRPSGAPKGSLILMSGGDGVLAVGEGGTFAKGKGNQLIRTRDAYVARGFAVLLVDLGTNLSSAVATMRKVAQPVTVVGTSRGTQRAAEGIAAGARPDALVLTSGFLSQQSGAGRNVIRLVGNPASLPRTLVIHHRQDTCQFTLPDGVAPFLAWAGPRARVSWLDGGNPNGDPCEARAYHGFNGIDGQVVDLVAAFAAGKVAGGVGSPTWRQVAHCPRRVMAETRADCAEGAG